MKLIIKSNKLIINNKVNNDNVHIFNQFFIPSADERYDEIKFCLKQNVENDDIDYIHLLCERIYTDEELGIQSNKIIQTNIGKRLTFQDVFQYIRTNDITGYLILLNSDIFFFSETINNLKRSNFHTHKLFGAILRYDYNSKDVSKSKIFGPRFDSQDTWILHSNFNIPEFSEKTFDFEFGKPGCDNKLIYLMSILGYDILNDPKHIKTLHFHESEIPSYTKKDTLPLPWGMLLPYSYEIDTLHNCLVIPIQQFSVWSKNFTTLMLEDNKYLSKYISDKIHSGQNFIIPRIAGIENNAAVFQRIINENPHKDVTSLKQYIQRISYTMKNNAGIQLSNTADMYSNLYLSAFEKCDIFASWEPQGGVAPGISQSLLYMLNKYKVKHPFWASTFDIFHYIFSEPWTHSLKGKRLLIVSPFIETIKEQLSIREHLYNGVDLFPGCTFEFLKPPQTQSDEPSQDFLYEMHRFKQNVDKKLNSFDIALVSCGGYGNPICAHIYSKGKSAIYVGGVLQMYFGILGNRWIKDRPDIIKLYHNKYWTRPKSTEKPKNCGKVEGACYW